MGPTVGSDPTMAYVSRRQRRPGIDIWPGFVDALSQLVMVIVFVLLLFVPASST